MATVPFTSGGVLASYAPRHLSSHYYGDEHERGRYPDLERSELVRIGKVRPAALHHTYQDVKSMFDEARFDGRLPELELASRLEHKLRSEQQRSPPSQSSKRFPRTLEKFTCFAVISAATGKHAIGRVLSDFIIKNGAYIARVERSHNLLNWGAALMNAGLHHDQIAMCARTFLKARPDLLQSAMMDPHYLSRSAREFLRCLDMVFDQMGECDYGHDYMGRGRGRLRMPTSRHRMRGDFSPYQGSRFGYPGDRRGYGVGSFGGRDPALRHEARNIKNDIINDVAEIVDDRVDEGINNLSFGRRDRRPHDRWNGGMSDSDYFSDVSDSDFGGCGRGGRDWNTVW
ncbi:hypothetical protein B0A49_00469 [Cryomyces minteri]|uniref:Uncharacterized protein n=1 Tax=Cryomyces minteri TaxID=331657 RepID=A0A4U0XVX5_9PEZI|nr:hypothetical protein B0A49_00469 [Cryomyces minteri]